MDNAGNSAEVAGRVERLQEIIAHHQVSEQCLVVPSMTYTEGRTSQQQVTLRPNANLAVRVFRSVYPLHRQMSFHPILFQCSHKTWRGNAFQQARFHCGTVGSVVLKGGQYALG